MAEQRHFWVVFAPSFTAFFLFGGRRFTECLFFFRARFSQYHHLISFFSSPYLKRLFRFTSPELSSDSGAAFFVLRRVKPGAADNAGIIIQNGMQVVCSRGPYHMCAYKVIECCVPSCNNSALIPVASTISV